VGTVAARTISAYRAALCGRSAGALASASRIASPSARGGPIRCCWGPTAIPSGYEAGFRGWSGANLGIDRTTFLGFRPLPMDPSQGEKWAAARGRGGAAGPTFIDATVPCRLRHAVTHSFRSAMAG